MSLFWSLVVISLIILYNGDEQKASNLGGSKPSVVPLFTSAVAFVRPALVFVTFNLATKGVHGILVCFLGAFFFFFLVMHFDLFASDISLSSIRLMISSVGCVTPSF